MPERTSAAQVASEGVTRCQLAVQEQLGWLFREQPTEDYGIDAQVEVVDAGSVKGKLLALQIKSGTSWFSSPSTDGWWFRPTPNHLQYWLNHSLPVVVVMYNPESQTCYWQVVSRDTLVRVSSGGWKLNVPSAQVLDASAARALSEAADDDPYVLRIRELRLARDWMGRLREGQRLVVDVEEWINKSSGRGSITIAVDNEDGNDPIPLASWGVLLGGESYAEAVPRLFQWAKVAVHEDTYYSADYDQFELERVVYDEGDRIVTETFDDWQAARHLQPLRPYTNVAGEVDLWRLELSLNDLGLAFLLVDDFASEAAAE